MGNCISCKESLTNTEIIAFDNMPAAAQHMPDKEQVKNDRGIHLPLCQCKKCGLIQFDCEPVEYYRDVIRAGGYSTTMVELRRRQYQEFIKRYQLEGKKIIEAGCGRGEFLRVLKEFPVKGYGIEHDPSLAEIAKESGLLVSCDFTETIDQKLPNGPFDAFLSFNFLEHQPSPDVMLTCLYNNLTDDGVGLITVPSFEYITDHNTYYELIHDHLAYYTFDSLTYLLNQNGFIVESKEMINRDTLSMVVRKTAMPEDGKMEQDDLAGLERAASGVQTTSKCLEAETGAQKEHAEKTAKAQREDAADAGIITPLTDGYAVVTGEIRALTERLKQEGRRLAMWALLWHRPLLLGSLWLTSSILLRLNRGVLHRPPMCRSWHRTIILGNRWMQC